MNALIINCSPVRTGATAGITELVSDSISDRYDTKCICIDDYSFSFCKGCRSCHKTAVCIQHDDIPAIIDEFERADIIIAVSPSYWADIPGQFKAFIDRCTPWCNTHQPHDSISKGKKGYSIALRTGPDMKECERVIQSIEHFFGHLEIECCGRLGLCSVEFRNDVEAHVQEITDFCKSI